MVTDKVSKLLVEVSLRIRGRYLVEPLQVEPLVLLMLGLLALDDVGDGEHVLADAVMREPLTHTADEVVRVGLALQAELGSSVLDERYMLFLMESTSSHFVLLLILYVPARRSSYLPRGITSIS